MSRKSANVSKWSKNYVFFTLISFNCASSRRSSDCKWFNLFCELLARRFWLLLNRFRLWHSPRRCFLDWSRLYDRYASSRSLRDFSFSLWWRFFQFHLFKFSRKCFWRRFGNRRKRRFRVLSCWYFLRIITNSRVGFSPASSSRTRNRFTVLFVNKQSSSCRYSRACWTRRIRRGS